MTSREICKKVYFAHILFTNKHIEMKVPPSCFSRQVGSNDVWYDLEKSFLKFTSGQGQVRS